MRNWSLTLLQRFVPINKFTWNYLSHLKHISVQKLIHLQQKFSQPQFLRLWNGGGWLGGGGWCDLTGNTKKSCLGSHETHFSHKKLNRFDTFSSGSICYPICAKLRIESSVCAGLRSCRLFTEQQDQEGMKMTILNIDVNKNHGMNAECLWVANNLLPFHELVYKITDAKL